MNDCIRDLICLIRTERPYSMATLIASELLQAVDEHERKFSVFAGVLARHNLPVTFEWVRTLRLAYGEYEQHSSDIPELIEDEKTVELSYMEVLENII